MIELWRFIFSKWRTAAILNFIESKNLTSVEVTGDCHTEFGKDISKGGRSICFHSGGRAAILNFDRKWKLMSPKVVTNR